LADTDIFSGDYSTEIVFPTGYCLLTTILSLFVSLSGTIIYAPACKLTVWGARPSALSAARTLAGAVSVARP